MADSAVTTATYTISGYGTSLTVTNPWTPTVTLTGYTSTLVYGGSMTAVATVTPTPDSYAWYLDGALLSGATSSSATLGSTALPGTHNVTMIATKAGVLASEQFSFTVTGTPSVVLPVFSVAAGSYTATQTVAISTTTPGATIRYTTDGTTPTETTGTIYGSALTLSATTTVKAIAYRDTWTSSAVATATYTIVAPTSVTHNFDTGTMPTGFVGSGTAGWYAASGNSVSGLYAARSGLISHYQSSTTTYTFTVPAGKTLTAVSLKYAVSSEASCDFLNIYYNGTAVVANQSGTIGWTTFTQTMSLPAGTTVTFAATYSKDGSVNVGSDCAWIDDIVLTLN